MKSPINFNIVFKYCMLHCRAWYMIEIFYVARQFDDCTELLSVQACVAAMVRIEHMDFLQPMRIGEVAELTAEIVYTSTHSLLVAINIRAENIITGDVTDCHAHIQFSGLYQPHLVKLSLFQMSRA